MTNELLATVDLGSNSFRLLIGKIDDNGAIYVVDEIKETVRLAGGLDANNNLNRESQALALDVLSRFSERLIEFNRSQVRVVATSTLRVAANANEFISKANKILGFKIEVISGNEEARLIYIGAVHSLEHTLDKRLVIDIGGGSTEFVIGSGYDPQIMESVTMGCVSFSNRYFEDGELTEANFDNAIYAARSKIQTMEYLFADHEWVLAIGTSGTAKSLYDLCIEYGYADHITLDGLYKIKKLMIKHKKSKHLNLNGLKEDRRAVIPGGLAIMIAIMEELKVSDMSIADGALREGVMYDLLGRKSNQDLRVSTVKSLKRRYSIDEEQSMRVANLALYLCKELNGGGMFEANYLQRLEWACELYEIGLSISHNDYHKHGSYILRNADMAGFSQPEQKFMADLVRSHRGGLSKACTSIRLTRKIKIRFLLMMLSFRLSVILNRNRKEISNGVIKRINIIDKNSFQFIVDQQWLQQNPLTMYSLNEEFEQWRALDFNIELVAIYVKA
jgi:exopolyphosphatase/guanosine-5'-triphosphate,3'-diphosphate pyrophosphatase